MQRVIESKKPKEKNVIKIYNICQNTQKNLIKKNLSTKKK